MKKWISVKDQPVPLDGRSVLVYVQGYIALITAGAYYYPAARISYNINTPGFGGHEWECNFSYEEITHWRSLPDEPEVVEL